MPMIEPPKFAEGNLNLPAVNRSSSSGSSVAGALMGGSRMNPKHVKDLLNQHHQNSMNLLDHSYTLQTNYDEGAHRRAMNAQAVTHEQSKDLETHRAGLAAQAGAQQHQQTLEAATHGAKLENKLAASNHKRTLELHNAINNAAQAGTELNIAFPHGGNVDYTKAGQQPAATTAAPAAPSRKGASWVSAPTGAKTLPIASKSSAPVAKEEGPKPLVKKGPGGKFQSLKSTEERVAKPKKASKTKSTGPLVKKGPGGKFQSLKD